MSDHHPLHLKDHTYWLLSEDTDDYKAWPAQKSSYNQTSAFLLVPKHGEELVYDKNAGSSIVLTILPTESHTGQ